MSMENEYLDFGFEIKQTEQEDPDYFFVEGLASTFGNTDTTRDVIRRGAFTETLKRRMPKVLWVHNAAEPIGMPVNMNETMEGLEVKLKMPKADFFVRERVMPQVKIKSIDAMSIGFRIPSHEDVEYEDDVRIIKKVDLHEISLVPFPANEMAMISGYKGRHMDLEIKTVTPFQSGLPIASTDRVWSASEAVSRVRQATGSTEKPSASYRRNFMWFDNSAPEEFGSYKLPFVDVINGTRTVIPRAINNIAARLDQTDIPASDKASIRNLVSRYQEKFKKSDDVMNYLEVKELNRRAFENVLRDSGLFSGKAATYIASRMPGDPVQEPRDDEAKALEILKRMNSSADEYLVKYALNDILK